MSAEGSQMSKRKMQSADATKSTEQARNRVNQRRLRERRKEYTDELERKLQTLERQGVHATEVMQKAARIVVKENRLLRHLLSRHGVSNKEIEDFVKTPSNAVTSNAPIAERVRSISAQPSSLPIPMQTVEPFRSAGHDMQDSPRTRLEAAAPRDVSVSNHTVSEAPNVPSGSGANMPTKGILTSRGQADVGGTTSASTPAVTASPPTSAPSYLSRRSGTDDMDCEEAARIISSLRGGHDPQDVWPELGCDRSNRTRVRKFHVMSLAD